MSRLSGHTPRAEAWDQDVLCLAARPNYPAPPGVADLWQVESSFEAAKLDLPLVLSAARCVDPTAEARCTGLCVG